MALLEMVRFTTKVPSQTRTQATCSYPNNLRELDKWPCYQIYVISKTSKLSCLCANKNKTSMMGWKSLALQHSLMPSGQSCWPWTWRDWCCDTHVRFKMHKAENRLFIFRVSTQYKNCKIKVHLSSLPWKSVAVCLLSMWMHNSTKMCLLMTWQTLGC